MGDELTTPRLTTRASPSMCERRRPRWGQSQVFRRTPNVLRSLHSTCSVCAFGPLAKELTAGHHVSRTGLSPDSPFGVMTRHPTAILGLGVEYFRCLTHVHTAAHKMGDAFPIKFENRTADVTLIDYDGSHYQQTIGLPDRTKKQDLRFFGQCSPRMSFESGSFTAFLCS